MERKSQLAVHRRLRPVRASILASVDEFLAGSAERPSRAQLGGHRAAGIADPGERDETPAHDEDGRDRVRHAERVHGRIVEGRSEKKPLSRVYSLQARRAERLSLGAADGRAASAIDRGSS
jgi:hypothetical protein